MSRIKLILSQIKGHMTPLAEYGHRYVESSGGIPNDFQPPAVPKGMDPGVAEEYQAPRVGKYSIKAPATKDTARMRALERSGVHHAVAKFVATHPFQYSELQVLDAAYVEKINGGAIEIRIAWYPSVMYAKDAYKHRMEGTKSVKTQVVIE